MKPSSMGTYSSTIAQCCTKHSHMLTQSVGGLGIQACHGGKTMIIIQPKYLKTNMQEISKSKIYIYTNIKVNWQFKNIKNAIKASLVQTFLPYYFLLLVQQQFQKFMIIIVYNHPLILVFLLVLDKIMPKIKCQQQQE